VLSPYNRQLTAQVVSLTLNAPGIRDGSFTHKIGLDLREGKSLSMYTLSDWKCMQTEEKKAVLLS